MLFIRTVSVLFVGRYYSLRGECIGQRRRVVCTSATFVLLHTRLTSIAGSTLLIATRYVHFYGIVNIRWTSTYYRFIVYNVCLRIEQGLEYIYLNERFNCKKKHSKRGKRYMLLGKPL